MEGKRIIDGMLRTVVGVAVIYFLGAFLLLLFIFFGLFIFSKNLSLAVTAIFFIAVTMSGKFYPFLWKNKFFQSYLTIIILFGLLRAVIGSGNIDRLREFKDVKINHWITKTEKAQNSLETYKLKKETALYEKNGEDILFKEKLENDLNVRISDITHETSNGIKYRRICLPVKRNGEYLDGIFDSSSAYVWVLPVDLIELLGSVNKEISAPKLGLKVPEDSAKVKAKADAMTKAQADAEAQAKAKEERQRKMAQAQAEVQKPAPAPAVPKPKPAGRFFVLDPAIDEDPSPYRALFMKNIPYLQAGDLILFEEGSISSVSFFVNGRRVMKEQATIRLGRKFKVPLDGNEIFFANSKEPIVMTPMKVRIVE
jgi:hypothetical protein